MFRLSVVIPTYNGRQHLERCLPSVCRHAPSGTQILVVDDASTDDTAVWVKDHFPRVELLVLPANQGFVGAVNEGLRRAQGEIIELLNNDTEVGAGWAEAALAHFKDTTVGSVAPLVLNMEQPDTIDSAGVNYHICGWAFNRGYNQKVASPFDKPNEVFGPSGSSGFYRRAALEKIGLLWPLLDAYFEDVDLAFRLRWAGWRCVFEPASRVLHYGSATYGTIPDRVTRLISRNEELIFWMNLSWQKLLLGFFPHLGFFTIRLIRNILSGRGKPFLAGKWQALWLWNMIRQRRKECQLLARTLPYPPDLALLHSTHVFSWGLQWLKHRRCA